MENRQKVNTNESTCRCYCFSPGERFMVTCMGVEERIWEVAAVDHQASVIHRLWGVNAEGEGGHFPRGSSSCKLREDNSIGSTSVKCLPDVVPPGTLTLPRYGCYGSCGTHPWLSVSCVSWVSANTVMIPQPFSWFRHRAVTHSADRTYARVSEERDFHATSLILNLKVLETIKTMRKEATWEWSQYRANRTKMTSSLWLHFINHLYQTTP